MKDFERTVYNAIKNGTYTTFDTLKDSYVHLYEEIIALQAENAKLTEQLKNAVVLPCKVGDTVYSIQHTPNPDNTIFECTIFKIDTSIIKTGIVSYTLSCFNQFSSREYLYFDEYKDHWFLTKSEAEARLKELEGKV